MGGLIGSQSVLIVTLQPLGPTRVDFRPWKGSSANSINSAVYITQCSVPVLCRCNCSAVQCSFTYVVEAQDQFCVVQCYLCSGLQKILNWLGTDQKWLPCAISRICKKKPYICSFQNNYPYFRGFYAFFLGFQTNLAVILHFWQLILAGGHLFLKLFQLASQKWLPKSQNGWELEQRRSYFQENR